MAAKRKRIEDERPGQAVDVLDRLTDPFASLVAISRDLADNGNKSLSRALNGLVSRLQKSGGWPAMQKAKQIKRETFVELLDSVAFNTLASVDEYDLAAASFKDKMIGVGIALEKRALLRGEPTQILSHEERVRLPELLEAGMREMERRGMSYELLKGDYSVEGEAPVVRVLPAEEVQEEAVSATARRLRGKLGR